MLQTIYVPLLILFVLSMGLLIGSMRDFRNDERFQSIAAQGYKYSWVIVLLGVTVGFSLSQLSFTNISLDIAIHLCMFSVLISGIFNGFFTYFSHKKV